MYRAMEADVAESERKLPEGRREGCRKKMGQTVIIGINET